MGWVHQMDKKFILMQETENFLPEGDFNRIICMTDYIQNSLMCSNEKLYVHW